MDRRAWTAVGIAAMGWMAASCGPPALTREQARSLIQQSDRFAPRIVQFDLTQEELESGAKAGYWSWRREKGSALSYPVFQLTSRGLAVFEGEGRDMVHGRMEFSHPVLTARPKLRAEIVEITRMADVPSSAGRAKVLEYTWQWDLSPLPADLGAVVDNPPRSATATLRRDADTWRVISDN